jgi:hypothetical protein
MFITPVITLKLNKDKLKVFLKNLSLTLRDTKGVHEWACRSKITIHVNESKEIVDEINISEIFKTLVPHCVSVKTLTGVFDGTKLIIEFDKKLV